MGRGVAATVCHLSLLPRPMIDLTFLSLCRLAHQGLQRGVFCYGQLSPIESKQLQDFIAAGERNGCPPRLALRLLLNRRCPSWWTPPDTRQDSICTPLAVH